MAAGVRNWTPRRASLAVAAVALLALAARLLLLGDRVAHWDEARVGYWILDYARTGSYEYRPIIHGPFYHHVNAVVFSVLGPTDAAMRLVPAVVGGLLPLSALLLRERLRGGEQVALALFLAANPVLLYYTRFMRGDPLVGAFMFVAFGLFVRYLDTRAYRYVLAGVAFVALGFTVKENAPVYLLCWVGAAAVVAYFELFAAARRGESVSGVVERWLGLDRRRAVWRAALDRARAGDDQRTDDDRRTDDDAPRSNDDPRTIEDGGSPRGARRALAPLAVAAAAVAEFLAIVVFFYAPRSGDPDELGLGNALGDPAMWGPVVEAATLGSWRSFVEIWIDGSATEHGYLPYLGDYLLTLAFGAAMLCLFAVVGFLAESFAEERPRGLVLGTFAWGVASVLGYPVITDIKAPWATVHAVLPLAVPAAVGVALVYRWGRAAFASNDRLGVGVAATVLLLVSAQVGAMGATAVYLHPQSPENELVQYAQPAADLHPTLADVERAAATTEGTDVLVYGERYVDEHPSRSSAYRPACVKWFELLPLPWYFERGDVAVSCARTPAELDAMAERPPVVVADAGERTELRARFPGYEARTGKLRTTDSEVLFLVDTSRLPREGDRGPERRRR
ncbi:flippase activity-associated protein Agl23 [Halomarina pelagica]|uniref:flippase activity-associated protein Agl23 n=1 Tax=Halomarina pelagica TaxID=2961599 RepID=UPI0020C40FD6|nr:flippase activity-associated protein Agl23 [Halomarina sp. BND7]